MTRPLWLLLLPLVPLAGFLAYRQRLARARFGAELGFDPRKIQGLSGPWLASAAFLILGLAGLGVWFAAGSSGDRRDLVVVLDVSRSMGAEDAVPDRLSVSKRSVLSLVDALAREAGTRLGVVAFAGRAVVKCPLTENLGAARRTLERLEPGSVLPGGSDLGAGVRAGLDLLAAGKGQAGGALLVVSDGEDFLEQWESSLPTAIDRQVPVHTIAVGNPESGTTIPIRPANTRSGQHLVKPLRYQGEVILTRRVDRALKSIAESTGGRFLVLGKTFSHLGEIDRQTYLPTARRIETADRQERASRYSAWAALSSFLTLTVFSLFGRFWRVRRMGWLGLLAAPLLLAADTPPDPGLRAYSQGKWQEALDYYQRSGRFKQADPEALHNVAACAFRLERYEEALELYTRARDRSSGLLRLKSAFAVGNTQVALGNLEAAIATYSACLADPLAGAEADRLRADALENQEFARAQLDQQKPESGDDEGSSSGSSKSEADQTPDNPRPAPSGSTSETGAGSRKSNSSQQRPPANRGANPDHDADSQSAGERWRQAVEQVERGMAGQSDSAPESQANTQERDW